MDILWILFAVFLFVMCAVLLVLEIFVPSFGIISVCAIACLIAGGSIFFDYGTWSGWIGVGIATVLIPTIWVIAYRIFPKTAIGRKIILGKSESGRGDAIPDHSDLQNLLHKTGIVKTPLRPVGICEFDGRRYECVSEREYIEIAKKVRVIRVEGTQLTVRLVNEENEPKNEPKTA